LKLKLAVRFSPYIQIFTKHYRHVLSEILHHSIHEEEKNEAFFVLVALFWLDAHDEIANFHLVLLLEVSKYLGFYPDTSDIDLPFLK
jgi:DNA repair protein RecO (recombination protein O)